MWKYCLKWKVDLSLELKSNVNNELSSLQMCQACQARLDECMDFLDILSGQADTSIGTYCEETLQLKDEEMKDLGPSGGIVRNVIQLRHLRALSRVLKDRLVDPLAQLDPSYCEPLPSDLQRVIKSNAGGMNLPMLVTAMKKNLCDQFQGFLRPVAADFNLGTEYGWLAYAETDEACNA